MSDFKTGDVVWYLHHQWQGMTNGWVKVKTKATILEEWKGDNVYDMFRIKTDQPITDLYNTIPNKEVYCIHTELQKI